MSTEPSGPTPPTPARPGPPHRAPRRSHAERNRATHEALLTAGRALFAERGVAHVSAEEVVAAAGVTRGALYHHFRDKHDLFRAVFIRLEEEACAEMTARIDAEDGVVAGLTRGIGWFFDLSERPDVRRIALLDAPAVLGWTEWRRIETEYALGVLVDRLRTAAAEGVSLPGPVEIVASMLFSVVIDAVLTVATAENPAATRARVEPTLYLLAARTLGVAATPPGEP